MSRVLILENEKEIQEDNAFYIRSSGNFNYFMTIDIRGIPRSTNSSIMIFCYSKANRQNIIATKFQYKRVMTENQHFIKNESNLYRCGVKDIQAYIEIIVKPFEEDFQGECKIVYGPIELDSNTKQRYNLAKQNGPYTILHSP